MPPKNTTRTLLAIIALLAGTITGLVTAIASHVAGATPPVVVTAGIGAFFAATTLAITTIAFAAGS